ALDQQDGSGSRFQLCRKGFQVLGASYDLAIERVDNVSWLQSSLLRVRRCRRRASDDGSLLAPNRWQQRGHRGIEIEQHHTKRPNGLLRSEERLELTGVVGSFDDRTPDRSATL